MFISTDFVEESSQNECEEKKEKRRAQTPVKKTGMYTYMNIKQLLLFFEVKTMISYPKNAPYSQSQR